MVLHMHKVGIFMSKISPWLVNHLSREGVAVVDVGYALKEGRNAM